MPGCVLRVGGKAFDVDSFLASSTFEPCKVWHLGESKRPSRPAAADSGFNLVVSDAGPLDAQVREVIEFLGRNREELRRLNEFPGVEEPILDFGILHREVAGQFDRLPPELISLAAEFQMGIEVSRYH
jgi:hypothetical protein